VEVQVDEADCCDDTHVDDAYSDARYDRQVYGEVPVGEGLHVDEAVPADVVVPVRMHICLQAGKKMQICIVS
jgi:hypothetical protein